MGPGHSRSSVQRRITEQSRHCLTSREDQCKNPAVKKATQGAGDDHPDKAIDHYMNSWKNAVAAF